MCLVWSVATYISEKPISTRFDGARTGKPYIHPVNGEDSDYWDLITQAGRFSEDNIEDPTGVLSIRFQFMRSEYVKYVYIEKAAVSISKIEKLPELRSEIEVHGRTLTICIIGSTYQLSFLRAPLR
jgi:hypothetical protein